MIPRLRVTPRGRAVLDLLIVGASFVGFVVLWNLSGLLTAATLWVLFAVVAVRSSWATRWSTRQTDDRT